MTSVENKQPSGPDWVVPAHVPGGLVVDYDVYDFGVADADFHLELYRLKREAPPIFWTGRNQGHWYVTDTALAIAMLEDAERFSSRCTVVPASNLPPGGFIPVSLDPPDHGKFRKPILRSLSGKRLLELEKKIRLLAREIIEDIRSRGRCEFMSDFAFKLPVISFMRLFDLPERDLPELMETVTEIVRPGGDKVRLIESLAAYLLPFVTERAANPGDDMISVLSLEEIDGERMGLENLQNLCTVLLIGGLDSVANSLGFIARFLAESAEHRRQIIEDPSLFNRAIDELLRRFPTTTVGTGRVCARDTRLGEADVRAGDMLMTATAMFNFDDTAFPDPMTVDFSRRGSQIGNFGYGIHRCLGAGLARLEISIFVKEWLGSIPDFQLADSEIRFQPGSNICLDRVPLEWRL